MFLVFSSDLTLKKNNRPIFMGPIVGGWGDPQKGPWGGVVRGVRGRGAHTRAHTHARTHARTRTHTHTHTLRLWWETDCCVVLVLRKQRPPYWTQKGIVRQPNVKMGSSTSSIHSNAVATSLDHNCLQPFHFVVCLCSLLSQVQSVVVIAPKLVFQGLLVKMFL